MDVATPSSIPPSPSREHLQKLFELLSGYRVSQALYVVARLGIADLLKDGPRGSEDLARTTETYAPALYRVLRFLSGVGLFSEVAPDQFMLTALGTGLRADVPGSIRPMALYALGEHNYQSWGHLMHSVQTGETAFEHVHGMGFFDYLAQHPEAAAAFNQSMTSNTAGSGTAITTAFDFSGIRRLVDVGGGHGLQIATVLRAYPAMQGVLFDRPEVVEGATSVLEEAGVAERCEIVSGDFFETVPPGGDAYVLRQIIHDWDDARATEILKTCRRAMQETARLLVVERVIASDYTRALPVLHLDLQMLVNLGGRQRSDDEYRALFAEAGFQLTSVVPLNDAAQNAVFEGVPA